MDTWSNMSLKIFYISYQVRFLVLLCLLFCALRKLLLWVHCRNYKPSLLQCIYALHVYHLYLRNIQTFIKARGTFLFWVGVG